MPERYREQIKRAEINQELDNMVKEATDLETDTKLQIDENASVINEKLLLLDNMKQTVEFGKDLSHEDLVNCREAVEDVAGSNQRFLAETGSYMYPEFKAMREPVGRISRGEVTTSAPEDHPRSATLEEVAEQPMARCVTNASQLNCTGNYSRFMHSCRRQPVADLGGARDTHPPVQILSISCSFWENLAKSYVPRPPPQGWRHHLGEILDPPL